MRMNLHNWEFKSTILIVFMCSFFIFIAGYYWGKKAAIENLLDACQQEQLSDKIAYSLCSIYEMQDIESDKNESQDQEQEDSESED